MLKSDLKYDRSSERECLESDFKRLYPLHRSITGDGLRSSLDIVGETIPLRRVEVPSGSTAFDWTVPPEWVVHAAYVIRPDGERILDIRDHKLYLLNYSEPFQGVVSKSELDKHLYSRPDIPDAIPYAISYYERQWGFCIPHSQREALPEGDYTVVIDTEFLEGSLSYGDCVLPGETEDEILFSSFLCHPQMASHELSGPLLLTALYERLRQKQNRRFTYRFYFGPETIGTICYLQEVGQHLKKSLKAGLIVTCAGDRGAFSYKRSAVGNGLLDRLVPIVAKEFDDSEGPLRIHSFEPIGSDERQYGSPGFNLSVGAFGRSLFGTFPEYHTSLDNEDVIDFNKIQIGVDFLERVCESLDANIVYQRTEPHCEPQLSKHPNLYPTIGGLEPTQDRKRAMMWMLNRANGTQDLIDIAETSGLSMQSILQAAKTCLEHALIVPCETKHSSVDHSTPN